MRNIFSKNADFKLRYYSLSRCEMGMAWLYYEVVEGAVISSIESAELWRDCGGRMRMGCTEIARLNYVILKDPLKPASYPGTTMGGV
jgi:hypothetical protein